MLVYWRPAANANGKANVLQAERVRMTGNQLLWRDSTRSDLMVKMVDENESFKQLSSLGDYHLSYH